MTDFVASLGLEISFGLWRIVLLHETSFLNCNLSHTASSTRCCEIRQLYRKHRVENQFFRARILDAGAAIQLNFTTSRFPGRINELSISASGFTDHTLARKSRTSANTHSMFGREGNQIKGNWLVRCNNHMKASSN
jgi:hypothetical protein